jgi:hypothetical protein
MQDGYVRSMIAHTAMFGVACALACGFAVDNVAPVALTAITACGFAVATLVSLRYDAAGWELPDGIASADLRRRRDVGVALGAAAAALACQSSRAALACSVVLMAAAAVNDFARFRLPLPLTIVGIVSAAARLVQNEPGELFAAVLPAIASIALLRRLRLDIGGGDVLAAVWIMLAVPWLGPAAMFVGHAIWLVLARRFDARGVVRRAPIGGVWLMAAAWTAAGAWLWGAA